MRKLLSATVLCSSMVLAAAALNGGEVLRLRVSPAVGSAPGFLTVRINVEPVADDRFLEVVAESADFYRSSQIAIDGQNASRLSVFEFRNLPSGSYHVTGVLVGVHGPGRRLGSRPSSPPGRPEKKSPPPTGRAGENQVGRRVGKWPPRPPAGPN